MKYVQDDEEAAEKHELKRRLFLDFVDGKEIRKKRRIPKMRDEGDGGKRYLELLEEISKMMNPGDGGDRGKECLQNVQEEKPAKGSHQRQTTDLISKEISLDDPMLTNDESKLNQDNLSIKTVTMIRESSLLTSSLSRNLSTGSSVSLTRQVRTSLGKSVRRTRAEENRAAHLRLCSFCNKNFLSLSSVPGCNIFSCSVCRRKSKAVDPASFLNIDFQNHPAILPGSGQKQRISKLKIDIIGRTPDTPVQIDSSSEEEDAVNDVGSAMNSCGQRFQSDSQCAVKRVTYPSRTDPEAVDILASDIQRLEPSEFLNDTIIDFYIRYIQRELLSVEGGRRFHFFNSFFYKKLSSVAGNMTSKALSRSVQLLLQDLQDKISVIVCISFLPLASVFPGQKKKKAPEFSKILNWTRGVNIFEKDYLIIPVHGKLHWSLAIICFPKYGRGSGSHCERCILHLDSMACGHESRTVFNLLRRYLVAKWKDTYGGAKMEDDDCNHTLPSNVIPGKKVPVPLQGNASDCGLFLLHYIRKFVENAPRTMKISDVEDRLEDLDVFGGHWFPPIEASNLKASIQEQLRRLFAEQERAEGMSSNTIVGIHEVVKPRNLGGEFREESVTCEAGHGSLNCLLQITRLLL